MTHHTPTTFGALLEAACDAGTLTVEQEQVLQDWRRDPEAWSARWQAKTK